MNRERVFSKNDCERMLNLFNNYVIDDEYEKEYIEALRQRMIKSKPVDPKKIKEDVVTANSKIILKNLGNGLREEFLLVFPEDSDIKSRKISIFSIIGSQILGNKIGAVIRENPNSQKYYMIEDILFRPEPN